LSINRVTAKKRLGQHFLIDKNIALKITDSLLFGNFNTLIEVGPGTGVLTNLLLEKHQQNFLAIEVDKESIDYLNQTYPEHTAKFIYGDFLKFPLIDYKPPIAIIGNFPYNISSQIFFRALENRASVNQIVCMVQKEVAERIASKCGNKTYGILSVLLQAYFNIEYLFTVNEKCFAPPPKVKSAVIRLTRNSNTEIDCDPILFFKVVKTTFNQRRKVISNSLKSGFENVPVNNELLLKRPEQLNVGQFVELTNLVASVNPKQ
jgi:16S rRNA (adenine1518-N6/adenine1519-N6)-dimethyltransferase